MKMSNFHIKEKDPEIDLNHTELMDCLLTCENDSNSIKINNPIGHWTIGNSNFPCYKKPNWFHIKMMRIILGINYIKNEVE